MKPSTQAVIYSALIFPGLGLWLLGKRGRAAVFAMPAIAAIVYMLIGAWKIAHRIAEQLSEEILATGQISLDIGSILGQVRAAVADAPGLQDAQWIFLLSWILGIVSTYAVGRSLEQTQPSPATSSTPQE
jgi:hypothetical protein